MQEATFAEVEAMVAVVDAHWATSASQIFEVRGLANTDTVTRSEVEGAIAAAQNLLATGKFSNAAEEPACSQA